MCVSGINHSSAYVKQIALKVGKTIVDNLVVLIPSTAMLMLNKFFLVYKRYLTDILFYKYVSLIL